MCPHRLAFFLAQQAAWLKSQTASQPAPSLSLLYRQTDKQARTVVVRCSVPSLSADGCPLFLVRFRCPLFVDRPSLLPRCSCAFVPLAHLPSFRASRHPVWFGYSPLHTQTREPEATRPQIQTDTHTHTPEEIMVDSPRPAKCNISSLMLDSKGDPPSAAAVASRNSPSRSQIKNLLNPQEAEVKREDAERQTISSSPLSQMSSNVTDKSDVTDSTSLPCSMSAVVRQPKDTPSSKEEKVEAEDQSKNNNDTQDEEDEHEKEDTENPTTDKKLVCKWKDCSAEFDDARLLYDHLCDFHVGRKCNKNLSLRCRWDNCQTITVKRDHITSHLRVHIPLKPYVCETCSKNFKRPQDLKKHTRTHVTGTMKDYKCNLLDPTTRPDYMRQNYLPYEEVTNKRSFEDMNASSISSPLSSCEVNLKRPHFQHSHTDPPFASRYVYKQVIPQSNLYPLPPHHPPPPQQLIPPMNGSSPPPPPPPHHHQIPQAYHNFNFPNQPMHQAYYPPPPHFQNMQSGQPPPPPPLAQSPEQQQQQQQPIFSTPLPLYQKIQTHPLRPLYPSSYSPTTSASSGCIALPPPNFHQQQQPPPQYPGNPGVLLTVSPASLPPPLPQRHDQLLLQPSQLRYIQQNYDNQITKEACNPAPTGQTSEISLAGSSPTTYNTNPVPLSYRRI